MKFSFFIHWNYSLIYDVEQVYLYLQKSKLTYEDLEDLYEVPSSYYSPTIWYAEMFKVLVIEFSELLPLISKVCTGSTCQRMYFYMDGKLKSAICQVHEPKCYCSAYQYMIHNINYIVSQISHIRPEAAKFVYLFISFFFHINNTY